MIEELPEAVEDMVVSRSAELDDGLANSPPTEVLNNNSSEMGSPSPPSMPMPKRMPKMRASASSKQPLVDLVVSLPTPQVEQGLEAQELEAGLPSSSSQSAPTDSGPLLLQHTIACEHAVQDMMQRESEDEGGATAKSSPASTRTYSDDEAAGSHCDTMPPQGLSHARGLDSTLGEEEEATGVAQEGGDSAKPEEAMERGGGPIGEPQWSQAPSARGDEDHRAHEKARTCSLTLAPKKRRRISGKQPAA